MSQKMSIKDLFERFSFAQQISAVDERFKDYAGCDQETSNTLATLYVFGDHGLIDLEDEDIKLLIDLLKEQIKSSMASSEKMDNYSKLGFRLPKKLEGIDLSEP